MTVKDPDAGSIIRVLEIYLSVAPAEKTVSKSLKFFEQLTMGEMSANPVMDTSGTVGLQTLVNAWPWVNMPIPIF